MSCEALRGRPGFQYSPRDDLESLFWIILEAGTGWRHPATAVQKATSKKASGSKPTANDDQAGLMGDAAGSSATPSAYDPIGQRHPHSWEEMGNSKQALIFSNNDFETVMQGFNHEYAAYEQTLRQLQLPFLDTHISYTACLHYFQGTVGRI